MPLVGKESKLTTKATKTNRRTGRKKVLIDDEAHQPERLEEKPMNVGVGLSRTINLGDYESLRIETSIHTPCNPGEEDDAWDAAFEWVLERLVQAKKELLEAEEE